MLGPLRLGALTSVLLAVSLLAGINPLHADDPAAELVEEVIQISSDPTYPLSARVLVRLHDNGQLEVCLETETGEPVCPSSRFFNPDKIKAERWIASSEFSWSVPFDPARVIHPPGPGPVEGSDPRGCAPDFERMMAATWRVETTKWLGSAFHIGDGRFLTAHHVIDGVPPFVTLTNGDRAVASVVLGSDPSVDLALLEVHEPIWVEDVPTVSLRLPEPEDLGRPVYLVGYPGGGPLTVSFGGLVTRVWQDEILTSSSSEGGNSGGPMFDSCGDVLGVLWAGSPSQNLSHSGATLLTALETMKIRRPPLPTNVPASLRVPPGALVWHFDTKPPADAECGHVNGDYWIGLAGISASLRTLQVLFGEEAQGSDYVYGEFCSGGGLIVKGFTPPADYAGDWQQDVCVESYLSSYAAPLITRVWHESSETFGAVRLLELQLTVSCPHDYRHVLQVDATDPDWWYRGMALFDAKGRRPPESNPTSQHWRGEHWVSYPFELPEGFVPAAFEVQRIHRATGAQQRWRVDIEPPVVSGPEIEISAAIAARVSKSRGTLDVCVESSDSLRTCSADHTIELDSLIVGQWRRTSTAIWSQPLSGAETGSLSAELNRGCALTEGIGQVAWQMSGLPRDGTGIYVGNGQFLVDSNVADQHIPWVLASQGSLSVPLIRVASDPRSGMSLFEVIDRSVLSSLGTPVALQIAGKELDDLRGFVVGFPTGDANRFTTAAGEAYDVTERTFRMFSGWSPYRIGAPAVDPCTRGVLGVNLAGGTYLRAEQIEGVLAELRKKRHQPAVNVAGPGCTDQQQ